jgi:ribonuclease HII
MSATADMLQYETQARLEGLRFIFGLDEAGRGPLAGCVVAAAVYLTSFEFENPINDSKKMAAKARERAFHEIMAKAQVGIGVISETAIDQINILNASHLAMEWAVLQLTRRLPPSITQEQDFIKQVILLIDGNSFRSQLPYRFRTIIGGDAQSLSISCASIVAKVYRDRLMDQYDRLFPQYGFKQHKGYPTMAHRQAIKAHGASIIHRRSFTLL